MIYFEVLTDDEITSDMFFEFNHYQKITKKWINSNNKWVLTDTFDLREWSKDKKIWISRYISQQMERGGSVVAAFNDDIVVGFCCLDGFLMGETARYANLTMMFVDDKWKRKGIGKKLFFEICKCAIRMKADKLFISAIPSFETVAFYFNMGCEDAKEIISKYIDTEQDRYLEFELEKLA